MTPKEELERSREYSLGEAEREPSVCPVKKKRMLTNADGRRCPTCTTVMKHLDGVLFGHERPEAATLEHINPICMGGSNEDRNLTVRCNLCNRASGHAMNEWLQRNQHRPPWDERKRMIEYLWLEVHDDSKAKEAYPDFFRSFRRKRELMTANNGKGGEKIAKRSAPRNGPSKTGNKSGGGRGNNAPRKK